MPRHYCGGCGNRWSQSFSAYRNELCERCYIRNKNLKARYDMSITDYDRMYREQRGACRICTKHGETLEVDHCHETGAVRGLLCGPCNRVLGMLGESTARLMDFMRYIIRWEERE